VVAASIYPPLIFLILLAIPKIRNLLKLAYNLDGINKENTFFTIKTAVLFISSVFTIFIMQIEIDSDSKSQLQLMLSADRLIISILVAPIAEEFVFRYLLLGNLLRRYSITTSLILSSLSFGILHHGFAFKSLAAILAGVVLSIIFVKTKSVTLTSLVHITNNLCVFIMMYCLTTYGQPSFSKDQKTTLIAISSTFALALIVIFYREIRKWKNLDFT
jgi:membrane protease YdiL (CAAX protease family)